MDTEDLVGDQDLMDYGRESKPVKSDDGKQKTGANVLLTNITGQRHHENLAHRKDKCTQVADLKTGIS